MAGCSRQVEPAAAGGEAAAGGAAAGGVVGGVVAGGAPGSSKPAATGVAVVELFSSESCSSCPPAEENLARIASTRDPAHVITLSFHVDYWNYLGWKDPFSSHDYTLRQKAYAKQSGGHTFTPEMFFNGAHGIVGSKVDKSDDAIDQALSGPAVAKVELALDAGSSTAGSYHVTGAPAGALLDIALLQRSADRPISGGENAGSTLHEIDIVRSFQALPLDGHASGQFSVDLPTDLEPVDVHIAAYVQDSSTLHILGGSATP